jgi:hypothetical protein
MQDSGASPESFFRGTRCAAPSRAQRHAARRRHVPRVRRSGARVATIALQRRKKLQFEIRDGDRDGRGSETRRRAECARAVDGASMSGARR